MVTLFYTADDLSIYAEALGYGNDLFSVLWREINLQTMSHIEDLVHLSPVRTALFVDRPEERRHREEIVLYHTDIVAYKVEYLGLGTT